MATKKDVTTAATATKADVKSAAKTAPVKTEAKAAPAKTETKAAATTKTEVKADAKKETSAKKTTTAKKTAAKTTAKKTTTRAAKKTTTKKTTAKAVKENVFMIEYDEINVSQADIMDKVRAALTEQGAKPAGLKNVDVYVQPKNNVAYYVSNAGKASEIKGSIALS